MEIQVLLDKLEKMATQAKRMPLTGAAILDADRLLEILDQMRVSLPKNVHDADEVLERREAIINQTMTDARRIRNTAESDARALVDESELVKAAKKRGEEVAHEAEEKAKRIIEVAEREAKKKMAGADRYTQEALANLEEQVLTVLNTIHSGQRLLNPQDLVSQLEGAK